MLLAKTCIIKQIKREKSGGVYNKLCPSLVSASSHISVTAFYGEIFPHGEEIFRGMMGAGKGFSEMFSRDAEL